MENRRKEQRFRVRTKGVVQLEGHKVRMLTENLSVSGARISLDRPLLEGAEVNLDLMLKAEDAPFNLCISGTVVWCTEDMDAGFQAGIAFTSRMEDTTALSAFLADYPAIQ